MLLFNELKRRRVFQVAAFYIVAAWVVLQVADLAFESWGIPEQAVRHVWVGALLGLPLVLLLGWRYDINWQGVVRTPVDGHDAGADSSLGRQDYVLLGTITILALAIISSVVMQVLQSQPATEPSLSSAPVENPVPDKSLAVLPFINMSDGAGNEYFSDGISEELLIRLNRIPELKVSARTSSFSYKNQDIGITEIARQLGVKHVLEGSVRQAGDRIRVTASLVDAQSGFELWSQTFDRQLEDVFAVQDEISTEVVDALKVSLLKPAASLAATENLEAYQLYLEGRFELHRRTAESIQRSIGLFEKAISLDSDFARAYLELATAIYVLPSFAPGDSQVATRKALPLAHQAMSLDPTLGKAKALVAMIEARAGNWTEARVGFEAALEISPRESIIYLWHATLLASMGQTRMAMNQVLFSYELDPQSGLIAGWLCVLNSTLGQNDKAVQHCRNALDLDFAYANFLYARIQVEEGNFEEAEELFISFSEAFAQDTQWVGPFMVAMRDPAHQAEGVRSLDSLESGLGMRWDIIGLNVLLGDDDSAFDSAAMTGWGRSTMNAIWMPHMLRFRQDPRFGGLMDNMGLVNYWQQYNWPDSCLQVGENLVCD